jgi:hypothetical protein
MTGSNNMERHFSKRDIDWLIEDGLEDFDRQFDLLEDFSDEEDTMYWF